MGLFLRKTSITLKFIFESEFDFRCSGSVDTSMRNCPFSVIELNSISSEFGVTRNFIPS